MTIIEKIKAEVDKRYAEYREKMKTDDFTYYEGMADALDLFEQFIDSLESEKPMDLGERIGSYNIVPYIDDKIAKLQDMWREEKVSFDWDDLKDMIEDVARHFAQWGAEHLADNKVVAVKPGDEVTINGHKIVYDKDKGYVTIVKSEESVPNDLEEAAWDCVLDSVDVNNPVLLPKYKVLLTSLFIDGAKWQKEHDAELIEIAYNDGITIGMTKQKEQMMEEAVDTVVSLDAGGFPFIEFGVGKFGLKVGDKVRVIVLPKEREK